MGNPIWSNTFGKCRLLFNLLLYNKLNIQLLFRQGSVAFSLVDVQEFDAMISDMDSFQSKEAGLLILAWAVFLCLISALPEKEDSLVLMVQL